MSVTLDESDSGILAGGFQAVGHAGRGVDAARMFESLSTKLFDAGETVNIGRFEIRDRLGAGGMGVVMSAFDPALHRMVAVKVLRDEGDPEEQARLLEEARAMAKLRHPNLVTVYEAGTHEGSVYIVMECVEGGTLRRWLDDVPRTWEQVARVFLDAAHGLAAIHDAGMVHRDFKPDNVLLGGDDRPQVSDFGLARARSSSLASTDLDVSENGDRSTTQTAGLVGTPNYLAPEQWQGQGADAASDQWSFCVTLHEALYGQRPFVATTVGELCLAVLSDKRAVLPASASVVPGWLDKVLARGLSTDPRARFTSMHELAAALAAGLDTHRGRSLRAAGLAAVSTGVIAAAAFFVTKDSPCKDVDVRLGQAWTAPRASAIADRFTAVPELGHAVWASIGQKLDARVEQWATQRRDACEATHVRGEQSEDALDLRMRCLDRRAVEVEALLDAYEDIEPEGVPTALTPLERLPALEVCADIEFLRLSRPTPESEGEREAVAALRERAGRLNAAVVAGDLAENRDAAATLVADAETLGYEPFIAEAKLAQAKSESLLGRGEAAGKLYAEAFEHALATHHLEVQVWSSVVATFVYAEQLKDPAQAERWGRQAQALLRAHPYFPQASRALETNLGGAAFRAGDLQEARQHFTEALRLFDEAGLGDSMDAIGTEANLGILERRSGNLEPAAARLQHAKARGKRALGDAHPTIGSLSNSLALTYVELGRFEEAEAQYRESLRLLESRLGQHAARVGHPLNNLGQFLNARGRAEEALPLLTRCIEIWTEHHGPDYPDLSEPLMGRAAALLAVGRGEDAKPDLERALKLQSDTASPDDRAKLLLLLAQAFAPTDPDRANGFIADARNLKISDSVIATDVAAWRPSLKE